MDVFQQKAEEILSHFYADYSNPEVSKEILKLYMDYIRMQGDAVDLIAVTQQALPHMMRILTQDADRNGLGDMFPWAVREEVVRQIESGTEEGIEWHIKMLILEIEPYHQDIEYFLILYDTPYECFSIQQNREWLSNWMDENF
jgi:hypothetical protein